MTNPTSNFGWQMPTSTDLVTDLPADFEVFGQAVDTSLADLKGGTTGQVLAKASNTDMDFVWSADAAGMTNPMTTTGDIIYSSPGSSPVRLGIGSTGNVLTVASGVPSWSAPISGGMTLISTTSLTGASISLSSIPATYNNLVLVVRNFIPSTDSRNLSIRVNGDATANRHIFTTSNTQTSAAFNDTLWNVDPQTDNATNSGNIIVTLYDYANTVTWKGAEIYAWQSNATTTTNIVAGRSMAFYNQTGAISSLDLFANAGNMTGGTALLYGVK